MTLVDYLLLVGGVWYITALVVEGYHGPLGLLSTIKEFVIYIGVSESLLNCQYCLGAWASSAAVAAFYAATGLTIEPYIVLHIAGVLAGMLILYAFMELIHNASNAAIAIEHKSKADVLNSMRR